MALLFKGYTPNNAVCFSDDGRLIIGDNNGNYNATTNPNGWGGVNPAYASINNCSVSVVNISSGIEYLDPLNLYDAPFELYTTRRQVEILSTDFPTIRNLRYATNSDNDQTTFEQGIFLISISSSGEYALGGDTVFWNGDLVSYIVPNISCWNETLQSYALSNCKKSKKAEKLLRYFTAAENYLKYFKFNSNITNDEFSKIDVLNALANKMANVCSSIEGGCKC